MEACLEPCFNRIAKRFVLRNLGQKRIQHFANLKQTRVTILRIVGGVVDAKKI
jgi:precorrin-6x reductase